MADQQSDGLTENTLESELIYDGRVVHLYMETVRLPNGNVSKREVIKHSGAVAIVAFDPDGNVLLVRQYRQATRRLLLEIPAGTLDPGEAPLDCAIRELQEEMAINQEKSNRLAVFLQHRATPASLFTCLWRPTWSNRGSNWMTMNLSKYCTCRFQKRSD